MEEVEVAAVVDRSCWTLHRPDSTNLSESVLVPLNITSSEAARRSLESDFLLERVVERAIRPTYDNFALKVCIPLEEENWVGQGVNEFDSGKWWIKDVERRRI